MPTSQLQARAPGCRTCQLSLRGGHIGISPRNTHPQGNKSAVRSRNRDRTTLSATKGSLRWPDSFSRRYAARIVVEPRNDVLRVPDKALQFSPSPAKSQAVPAPAASTASSPAAFPAKVQSEIWVLRGSVPVAVNIVTGLDDGNFTEIAEGDLKPGDRVIVGESRPQANTQQGAP